ncbi:MAG TPA: hypothetical protein VKB34_04915 [Povalibacter sp.]|nr:hypothetical protein [Povalibacter sp.]
MDTGQRMALRGRLARRAADSALLPARIANGVRPDPINCTSGICAYARLAWRAAIRAANVDAGIETITT